MTKHYLGYTLEKSDRGFTLRTPGGTSLCGVAVNFKTACKWVEQHLAETCTERARRASLGGAK